MMARNEGERQAFALAGAAFQQVCAAIQQGRDSAQEERALGDALLACKMAVQLTDKVADAPEVQGATAEMFRSGDQQTLAEELLRELREVAPGHGVGVWYKANRVRLEKLQDPKLRNRVFDAIRGAR